MFGVNKKGEDVLKDQFNQGGERVTSPSAEWDPLRGGRQDRESREAIYDAMRVLKKDITFMKWAAPLAIQEVFKKNIPVTGQSIDEALNEIILQEATLRVERAAEEMNIMASRSAILRT